MEISAMMSQSIHSLRQAINMTTLQKAMNQDAQSVTTLLGDMQKTMEMSVQPHKGSNLDITL
ncbi:putative motility protein [Anaerophilus nitritogenes]|uniref:putative motility protein n=1 Tax=Anaerophilus nitritogenes TaxID=2498136 RepID=UPI00101D542D|nr:putative motility protein [Anaerophilus nitritogenes]